jgi:hypothetical protein
MAYHNCFMIKQTPSHSLLIPYNKVSLLHSTKCKTSYFSHLHHYESHYILVVHIQHIGKKLVEPQYPSFFRYLEKRRKLLYKVLQQYEQKNSLM